MEVYAYKCRKCGHVHYPYKMICHGCGENKHDAFDLVPMTKDGKLLTFTIVHNLPPDFEVPTLAIGIVELDDGMRIMGQLKVQEPELGMKLKGKVEVVRHGDYTDYHGMVFYAA